MTTSTFQNPASTHLAVAHLALPVTPSFQITFGAFAKAVYENGAR
jgi:hypothetical protein